MYLSIIVLSLLHPLVTLWKFSGLIFSVVSGVPQGQITLMDVRVFKAIQPEVSGYQLDEERNVFASFIWSSVLHLYVTLLYTDVLKGPGYIEA